VFSRSVVRSRPLLFSSTQTASISSTPLVFRKIKEDDVEDMPTKMFREKAMRKKIKKASNPATGQEYSYAWRYDLLKCNKPVHGQLKNLLNDNRLEEFDERWRFLRLIGKHPSPHMVEILVEHYSHQNRIDEAIEAMDMLSNDLNKLTRDTFRHLAVAYIHIGNFEKVDETIAALHKVYPEANKYNERMYGALAANCWDAKDLEKASFWLNEFKKEEYKLTDQYNKFLKEIPIKYLQDNTETFVDVLSGFKGEIGAYDFIAYRYASAGLVKNVQNLIKLMESKKLTVIPEIYDSLVSALLKKGRLDDALRVIDEMREKKNGNLFFYLL